MAQTQPQRSKNIARTQKHTPRLPPKVRKCNKAPIWFFSTRRTLGSKARSMRSAMTKAPVLFQLRRSATAVPQHRPSKRKASSKRQETSSLAVSSAVFSSFHTNHQAEIIHPLIQPQNTPPNISRNQPTFCSPLNYETRLRTNVGFIVFMQLLHHGNKSLTPSQFCALLYARSTYQEFCLR